jgi:hypothetical protein
VPLREFENLTNMALEKLTIHEIISFNKVFEFLKNTGYLNHKPPVLSTVIEAFVTAYGLLWQERKKAPHITVTPQTT